MKILAGCIVRASEFFLHSGYLSAAARPTPLYNLAPAPTRYDMTPANPPLPPAPAPPTGAAYASFGNSADITLSEGLSGDFVATSDAVATQASAQGFYLDMFSGADRWTTLLLGIVLLFITAAVITVMRGRRVTIDDAEPTDGVEILEAQTSEST